MTRTETKTGRLAFLVHVILATLYGIAIFTFHSILNEKTFEKAGLNAHRTFGGRLKFLTNINMYMQGIYFFLCCLNAIVEYLHPTKDATKPRLLQRVLNVLFTALMFPIGSMVTLSFWGIYAIDRALIYPIIYESIIPYWQNHLVHTLPLISSLIGNVIMKHNYSASFLKGTWLTFTFSFAYMIWVFVIAHFGGFWVYPVLAALSTVWRLVFFLFLFACIALFYVIGKCLNALTWPDTNKAKEKKHH